MGRLVICSGAQKAAVKFAGRSWRTAVLVCFLAIFWGRSWLPEAPAVPAARLPWAALKGCCFLPARLQEGV